VVAGERLGPRVGAAIALAGAVIAGLLLREPAETEVVRLATTNTSEEAEREALAA
jgi:hypothetical protein